MGISLSFENWIILAVLIAILYAIRLRREAVRHALRRLILVGLVFLGVVTYLQQKGES